MEVAKRFKLSADINFRKGRFSLNLKKELIGFIEEQIKIERRIVESLNSSLGEIANPAIKAVLKGISLDSLKHAEMYSAANILVSKVPPALTQANLDSQRELVENHIAMEAQLIKRISEVIPKVANEKVKLLLKAILSDEERHHQLLKEVLETLVRGETLTEEDWWEVLWKNVPFHGAPGG